MQLPISSRETFWTSEKFNVTKGVQKSTTEMTWRNGIQHCDRERAIRTSAGEPDYDKK